VLCEDVAPVGTGEAVTKELKVYESSQGVVPFRLIDSMGLEYSVASRLKLSRQVRKLSGNSVRSEDADSYIHMVWYCIDSNAKRVFKENIDIIHHVAKMWKNVPIIVVFTKAYSEYEDKENIRMINRILESYKYKDELNIRRVLSVVAQPTVINEDTVIPCRGLEELVFTTNELTPVAYQLAEAGAEEYKVRLERKQAQAIVAAVTTEATVVGMIPIPIPDSTILCPSQIVMLRMITKSYGLGNDKNFAKDMLERFLEVGAVTTAAHGVLNALKAVPGLNLAAATMNAIVAGTITFAMGQVYIRFVEGARVGKYRLDDYSVLDKLIKSDYAKVIANVVERYSGKLSGKNSVKEIFDDVLKDDSEK